MLPSGPHYLALSASTTQSNPVVGLELPVPFNTPPAFKLNGVADPYKSSRLNIYALGKLTMADSRAKQKTV